MPLLGLFCFGYIAVLLRLLTRHGAQPQAPPDPAFAEDQQWAGVETSWHEFLDQWPVLEEDTRP